MYYHFKVVFERNAVDETVSSSECQGCFIERIGQKLLSKSVAWWRERRLSEVQHQPAHRNSGTQMWACLIVYFWRTWLGGYELSTKSAWNEMKSWLDGKFGEVTITPAIHFPIIPQTRRTFVRGLITFFLQVFHRRHLPRNGNTSRSIHHSAHSTEYRLSQEINKANFNNPPLNPNMIKRKKEKKTPWNSQSDVCKQTKRKKTAVTFSSWLLQLNVACNCSCTETNLLWSSSSASCGSGDPRHVTAGGKIAAECIAHSLCLVLRLKEREGEGRVDRADVKPLSSAAPRHRHLPFSPRTIVFCF